MEKISTKTAARWIGETVDSAIEEPLVLTRGGREVAVLCSKKLWDDLTAFGLPGEIGWIETDGRGTLVGMLENPEAAFSYWGTDLSHCCTRGCSKGKHVLFLFWWAARGPSQRKSSPWVAADIPAALDPRTYAHPFHRMDGGVLSTDGRWSLAARCSNPDELWENSKGLEPRTLAKKVEWMHSAHDCKTMGCGPDSHTIFASNGECSGILQHGPAEILRPSGEMRRGPGDSE